MASEKERMVDDALGKEERVKERDWKDFEGRFSRVVLERYRDRLDSLPAEKQVDVIDRLRQRFREYENDPDVNNEKQIVPFFGKWQESIDKHWADSDRIVYDAVKAEKAGEKQERGSMSPEEYAKKLSDDFKAKTAQGHQQDHDRER